MKNNFNIALRKDSMIESKELMALNQTYYSALSDFNKHNPYVFWKPIRNKNWLKMKISGGKGDISEGYAYFYYKSNNETNFGFAIHHLYDNLDTFFRIGVASVSNLSGLYGGDISTK